MKNVDASQDVSNSNLALDGVLDEEGQYAGPSIRFV